MFRNGSYLVFAYGSNMSSIRMRRRAPRARVVGVARLKAHELRFHKRGDDGSGKADALHTGNQQNEVWGVLYELSADDKAALDLAEGLGTGYREREVEVEVNRRTETAWMYYAAEAMIDRSRVPYTWYKRYVVAGAREHGLPEAYTRALEEVEAVEDEDRERHGLNSLVSFERLQRAAK